MGSGTVVADRGAAARADDEDTALGEHDLDALHVRPAWAQACRRGEQALRRARKAFALRRVADQSPRPRRRAGRRRPRPGRRARRARRAQPRHPSERDCTRPQSRIRSRELRLAAQPLKASAFSGRWRIASHQAPISTRTLTGGRRAAARAAWQFEGILRRSGASAARRGNLRGCRPTADGDTPRVTRLPVRATFGTFFAVRGTHLAAMVAYFALASVVPLVFLALAMLGFFGRVDESSALVTYLSDLLPSQSVDEIVGTVRRCRTTHASSGSSAASSCSGARSRSSARSSRPSTSSTGGPTAPSSAARRSRSRTWSPRSSSSSPASSSAPSGRTCVQPLRPRLRRQPAARGRAHDRSSRPLALFLFLLSAYYRLTNARVTRREVLPGAILGAIALEVALQALPIFVQLVGRHPRAARPGRNVPAARVALRAGECDRLRRGTQLAARPRANRARGRGEAIGRSAGERLIESARRTGTM